MGVKWVRQLDRTYDVGKMQSALKEALETPENRPKSHHCLVRMYAQQTTARETSAEESSGGGQTHDPYALWRG